MLNGYLTAQVPITITLQNKIRVVGRVKAFDSYVIVMEGQKREIIYRHAVSCLAPSTTEEPKRTSRTYKTASMKTIPKSAKTTAQNHRSSPQPQAMFSASTDETGLNNSMKEGLIKWMQEQKAAK